MSDDHQNSLWNPMQNDNDMDPNDSEVQVVDQNDDHDINDQDNLNDVNDMNEHDDEHEHGDIIDENMMDNGHVLDVYNNDNYISDGDMVVNEEGEGRLSSKLNPQNNGVNKTTGSTASHSTTVIKKDSANLKDGANGDLKGDSGGESGTANQSTNQTVVPGVATSTIDIDISSSEAKTGVTPAPNVGVTAAGTPKIGSISTSKPVQNHDIDGGLIDGPIAEEGKKVTGIRGYIKVYNPESGWGFIKGNCQTKNTDVFLHRNGFVGSKPMHTISEHDQDHERVFITYTMDWTEKKPIGVDIKIEYKPHSSAVYQPEIERGVSRLCLNCNSTMIWMHSRCSVCFAWYGVKGAGAHHHPREAGPIVGKGNTNLSLTGALNSYQSGKGVPNYYGKSSIGKPGYTTRASGPYDTSGGGKDKGLKGKGKKGSKSDTKGGPPPATPVAVSA